MACCLSSSYWKELVGIGWLPSLSLLGLPRNSSLISSSNGESTLCLLDSGCCVDPLAGVESLCHIFCLFPHGQESVKLAFWVPLFAVEEPFLGNAPLKQQEALQSLVMCPLALCLLLQLLLMKMVLGWLVQLQQLMCPLQFDVAT